MFVLTEQFPKKRVQMPLDLKMNCGLLQTQCVVIWMLPNTSTSFTIGLFDSYISDSFEDFHANLVSRGRNPELRDEYIAKGVFWVPEKAMEQYCSTSN